MVFSACFSPLLLYFFPLYNPPREIKYQNNKRRLYIGASTDIPVGWKYWICYSFSEYRLSKGLRVFLVLAIFSLVGSLDCLVPLTMYREDYFAHRAVKQLSLTTRCWLGIMSCTMLFSAISIFLIGFLGKEKISDTLDHITKEQRKVFKKLSTSNRPSDEFLTRSILQKIAHILSFHVFLMLKPQEYWKCCDGFYRNDDNYSTDNKIDAKLQMMTIGMR